MRAGRLNECSEEGTLLDSEQGKKMAAARSAPAVGIDCTLIWGGLSSSLHLVLRSLPQSVDRKPPLPMQCLHWRTHTVLVLTVQAWGQGSWVAACSRQGPSHYQHTHPSSTNPGAPCPSLKWRHRVSSVSAAASRPMARVSRFRQWVVPITPGIINKVSPVPPSFPHRLFPLACLLHGS